MLVRYGSFSWKETGELEYFERKCLFYGILETRGFVIDWQTGAFHMPAPQDQP